VSVSKLPAAAFDVAIYGDTFRKAADQSVVDECKARAKRLFEAQNPNAKRVILDSNPLVSVICGRRGGKTFGAASLACITGEARPHSITLVISLTLKHLKRNWWFGSPSGVPAMDRTFGLGLEFNSADLRWTHQNGSVGYLLGAESREMLDYIRGIEADVVIIDECKSFAPAILCELIDEILRPMLMSRKGRLILIGTPGAINAGEFYHATNPQARRPFKVNGEVLDLPALLPYGTDDPWKRNKRILWSFHQWHTRDNLARPDQWEWALEEMDRKGWAPDSPSWLREYEGQWLPSGEGLVYKYQEVKEKDSGLVNWSPTRSVANPTGLPQGRKWHLIMGLDLGFMDATALVVGAWSDTDGQLYHVHDEKHTHLLPDDVCDMVNEAISRFGAPEVVFGDAGGLGKMLVEMLLHKGIPIEKASKTEKNDHIELLNSDFCRGRIKIIPGSELEGQLQSVQWNLSKGALTTLAKTGRLTEDPACANDLTDAFLYMWRGAMHHFSRPTIEAIPIQGTTEYTIWQEARALEQARRRTRLEDSRRGLRQGPLSTDLKWGSAPPGIPGFLRGN
jgi:hypothetical protein